ncbi:MAG: cyclic nucleotide-binding domain-containing protein [Acidobacteriota bacterium]
MFDWLKGGKKVSLDVLIARKEYGKAIEILKERLAEDPEDGRIQLQLADVLALGGWNKEAADLLTPLADAFSRGGFVVKAIALFKRIQRLDPSRKDIDARLESLVTERDLESMVRLGKVNLPPEIIEPPKPKPPEPPAAAPVPVPPRPPAPAPVPMAPAPPAPAPKPAAPVKPAPVAEERVDQRAGIASTPLFSEFSEDELLAVIHGLRLQSYDAGDIVFAEGEPGNSLYVIAEGSVRVFVKNTMGRNMALRELPEGSFFGEISILSGTPRTATITAATRCELLELDRPTLDAISEKHPHVRQILQEFYDRRSNNTIEAMVRKASTDAPPS